jgi:tyrosyl-tRNA synthetase
MRKLRQFQELGHEVVFLIGNYTSLLGDPSDKNKARELLTAEDVARNGRTYSEQAFRILDPQRTLVRFNAEWLSALSFLDVIKIAQNFTVQQFLTRENFALLIEKGEPIYLHETFYALMQGYDAVALETDVQVGGSDQLFNILTAGRKLQEAHGQRPQIGLFVKILPGTDGVVKMSKSLGNHIPILASPEDMYGKVMSVPDSGVLRAGDALHAGPGRSGQGQAGQRREPARRQNGAGSRNRLDLPRRRSRSGRRTAFHQSVPERRRAG